MLCASRNPLSSHENAYLQLNLRAASGDGLKALVVKRRYP
jgi:hypothetical protein